MLLFYIAKTLCTINITMSSNNIDFNTVNMCQIKLIPPLTESCIMCHYIFQNFNGADIS